MQLIKKKLVNMRWTQTYMSGKLTEVHQSIVLDCIMHNFDLSVAAPTVPKIMYSIHILAGQQ